MGNSSELVDWIAPSAKKTCRSAIRSLLRRTIALAINIINQ
jgi:hypothetical protein